MLVVDRSRRTWEDRTFRDFPSLLAPGDCVVINDTRVIPARLFGHREGFDGLVEVLLIRPMGDDPLKWLCLVHPGKKVRSRERISFEAGLTAEVIGRSEHGERIVWFHCDGDLLEMLDRVGHVPLPPYIRRKDTSEDRARYQTVFADRKGSVAAPTAGLHFTPEILAACPSVASITLHVGLGTFQPLHAEDLDQVKLHSEWFSIREEEAAKMRVAQRLVCVGTTTVRTLESAGLRAAQGETDLFIRPGYRFKHTGAMLTNFHLPRSSLFILVCAFGGRELILNAYHHAISAGYRFYSYGDCMLIV